MAKSRNRLKGRNDKPGGFAGIPRVVMDHPDYQSLNGGAIKLLLELCRQYRGNNNGDLTTAFSVLRHRGFNSTETIKLSRNKLLKAGLIICTREGIFTNPGGRCALYALTWKSVDECPGKNLTISPTATPPRQFSLDKIKKPIPETGHGSNQKLVRQRQRDTAGRYSSNQKLVRLVEVT